MKRFLMLLIALPSLGMAQDETGDAPAAAQQPPPNPCATEKHRQFDFWVGTWDVTQNGQPAGHNVIELRHNDCVLAENWTSANGGFTGSSLNTYDAATDRWHQTWVDTSGTLLELNGGFQDGSMVLEGTRPAQGGGEVINRITWTPNEDGSVRQHWQFKAPGADWATAFDGLYVKSADAE